MKKRTEELMDGGQYLYWNDPYYHAYERIYGLHFNSKLSMVAVMGLKNRDGSGHKWTKEQVKAQFDTQHWELPEGVTWCDVYFQANRYYSDFFGSSVKSEAEILMMVHDIIHDPDGYPTMIFTHWLADLMTKGEPVDWESMV